MLDWSYEGMPEVLEWLSGRLAPEPDCRGMDGDTLQDPSAGGSFALDGSLKAATLVGGDFFRGMTVLELDDRDRVALGSGSPVTRV